MLFSLVALVNGSLKMALNDESILNSLFLNNAKIDEHETPRQLFVDIKSPNQEANKREIFAIESQNDFFIECQINSQLSTQPRVVWWFKSSVNNTTKIINSSNFNQQSKKAQKHKKRGSNTDKITIVTRIYIDCPNTKHEGEYFCAAIDQNVYHISQIRLSVLTPKSNSDKSKTCETTIYKMFGPSKSFIHNKRKKEIKNMNLKMIF